VGEVFQPTVGEVVDNDDIYSSIRKETIDKVATNEAGPAGNDNFSGALRHVGAVFGLACRCLVSPQLRSR
jgi:hypothetical protein